MINTKDLINNLNKATVFEVKHEISSFIRISISIPTDDLDVTYSLYNSGVGLKLYWEGMDMIQEDINLTAEDFKLLHKEVLKELMKRSGV